MPTLALLLPAVSCSKSDYCKSPFLSYLISALPPLKPTSVYNTRTGEAGASAFKIDANRMVDHISREAAAYWQKEEEELKRILVSYNNQMPAEWGRQNNVYTNNETKLPRSVKAQSRIDRIIRARLVGEGASYVKSPNVDKGGLAFGPQINLAVVDRQMASLSVNLAEKALTLLWKCWENEYLITFSIPTYVTTKNIEKFSLPVVARRGSEIVFLFTVKETTSVYEGRAGYTAGIDLGKVIPYVAVVVNPQGLREAHYTSSPRLKKANDKRERLLQQGRELRIKIESYKHLGINSQVLSAELNFLYAKTERLSNSIAWIMANEIHSKLEKHRVEVIHVEDLSWLAKKKIASRWAHSKQQKAITHVSKRAGVPVEKKSPRFSSQLCHNCGDKLIRNSKNRTVRCIDCKESFDRDFNAAMNMATLKHLSFPLAKQAKGDDCSPGQVVAEKPSNPVSEASLFAGMKPDGFSFHPS